MATRKRTVREHTLGGYPLRDVLADIDRRLLLLIQLKKGLLRYFAGKREARDGK